MTPGLWYALAAYLMWGSFPLYFRLLAPVSALEVLGHRIVWSFLLLVCVLAAWRGLPAAPMLRRRVLTLYTLAGVLIGVNWYVYVWAVNAGLVVETSLGYFITPLVNVALGVAVFRERLRPAQAAAVGLAAAGVGFLAVVYGSLPWVSLVLAASFGTYTLIKKAAPLDSLRGLAMETGALFVPAVWYLSSLDRGGQAAFLHMGAGTDLLLAATGPVTVLPLILFGAAVRRVPLSVIGILQYIAPSMQFLIGVLVFGEPFSRTRLAGFAMVWAALALFALDGAGRRAPPV